MALRRQVGAGLEMADCPPNFKNLIRYCKSMPLSQSAFISVGPRHVTERANALREEFEAIIRDKWNIAFYSAIAQSVGMISSIFYTFVLVVLVSARKIGSRLSYQCV